jgi:hypothetical protein
MSELKLPERWQSLARAGHSRKAWTATYEPLARSPIDWKRFGLGPSQVHRPARVSQPSTVLNLKFSVVSPGRRDLA